MGPFSVLILHCKDKAQGRCQGTYSVCSDIRAQEECYSRSLLQKRKGFDQGKWPTTRTSRAKALQYKLQEPILLLGKDRFADVDIRIRVKGGGHNSQIYAIRQALSKSLVSYYQKYVDEQSKKAIKDILIQFDRTLLVADPRRCEAK